MNGNSTPSDPATNQEEVYEYDFDHEVFALSWTHRRDNKFRLAVGSLKLDQANRVDIITLDQGTRSFRHTRPVTFDHRYPATKISFIPDADGTRPDLLATSSDFLRIWRVDGIDVKLDRTLSTNRNSDYCSPITSFDWNEADCKRLGTASIDTTCTIWDVERGVVDTQLIAHDKEVYDIAWGGAGVFASVSADGSVRVFDLRDKEHSTIIYETDRDDMPLLRLAWNKQDPRYMATLAMDSPELMLLDIRQPSIPVSQLQRHDGNVNALAWAPHSQDHMCTAGDDCQALIWDLSGAMNGEQDVDPILAYDAGRPISQLQWSSTEPDWVAICLGNKVQVLRV